MNALCRRTLQTIGAAVVVAVVVSLFVPAVVFAGHGTAPEGWPDNKNQYVDRHSLGADAEISVSRGIAQIGRSDLNVTLEGSGDIDVYDSNFGKTGWDGLTECSNRVITTWLWQRHCDVFTIKFNTYATSSYSIRQNQVIGCHEFGHTAGLDHRAASNDASQISCMRGSGFTSNVLDLHDLEVVNNKY